MGARGPTHESMAHGAPVSTSNIVPGKRARKATAAALASIAHATDTEPYADRVGPETRRMLYRAPSLCISEQRSHGSLKSRPKFVKTVHKYFCVGGGEYESKVDVRTAGRGPSGIILAKNCPLLKDLCPYNQNPWAYLSKEKIKNQRRLGLDMLTYNAKIARDNVSAVPGETALLQGTRGLKWPKPTSP